MIVWIITASLIPANFEARKQEYIEGINSLLSVIPKHHKVIIVENNGTRFTFLDEFPVPVVYTTNNLMHTRNKGKKELADIIDVIEKYKLNDEDLVVKMTGRYKLDKVCDFLNHLDESKYDCVLRYGSVFSKTDVSIQQRNINDCVTGLIAMKVKWIKTLIFPAENQDVESIFALQSRRIPNTYVVDKLGIWVRACANQVDPEPVFRLL